MSTVKMVVRLPFGASEAEIVEQFRMRGHEAARERLRLLGLPPYPEHEGKVEPVDDLQVTVFFAD